MRLGIVAPGTASFRAHVRPPRAPSPEPVELGDGFQALRYCPARLPAGTFAMHSASSLPRAISRLPAALLLGWVVASTLSNPLLACISLEVLVVLGLEDRALGVVADSLEAALAVGLDWKVWAPLAGLDFPSVAAVDAPSPGS